MEGIYAIYDTKAEEITGILMRFKHDAPAIRFFGDLASDPQTNVAKHVDDYQLFYLGHLHGLDISPEIRTVITGAQWSAAQQADREHDKRTYNSDMGRG